MNWYRRAQDEILEESFKDFYMEDLSQKFVAQSEGKSKVFQGSLEKILAMFGFKAAGYGIMEEDDYTIVLRVFPTVKVETPNTYQKTKEMRDRMDGLDKEKAKKLITFLKSIPGVTNAYASPANDGHDWAFINISLLNPASYVHANSTIFLKQSQSEVDEDLASSLEETLAEERELIEKDNVIRDGMGNIIWEKGRDGIERNYFAGKVKMEKYPDGKVLEYDANGNVVYQRLENGEETSTGYDDKGEIIWKTTPDGRFLDYRGRGD